MCIGIHCAEVVSCPFLSTEVCLHCCQLVLSKGQKDKRAFKAAFIEICWAFKAFKANGHMGCP